MPRTASKASPRHIASVVHECLPRLRVVSLSIETYGEPRDAATLHAIIEQLEKACPATKDTTDHHFVVAGMFKVQRSQVASLLCCAFDDSYQHWFRVVEFVEPPTFHFRVHLGLVMRQMDYPLNEGGSLGIRATEPDSNLFRLDLESIASGLSAMASECPRHFADFLNGKADAITGSAFLQCCLFGETVY